mmetsp:Transcript_53135/g.68168  ORF Transcript_53135/g.68168 Transcript_53135/m.68168 type:complete len:165 (+) Transcript_53135:24-518(+)
MAEIETLFKTESCSVENLRPEILEGCCELWSIAFAKPGRDKNSVMTERLKEINEVDERIKNFSCEEVWHVIWESCEGSNRIVAAARTFSRMMLLSDGTKVLVTFMFTLHVTISSIINFSEDFEIHIFVVLFLAFNIWTCSCCQSSRKERSWTWENFSSSSSLSY